MQNNKHLNINETLMDAVSSFNPEAVRECLDQGADPNYRIFEDEEEPNGLIQPTTPLRLVLFRISDCMLEDRDLEKFAEIVQLLLDYGANPKPAMQIAEVRYGKYSKDIEKNHFTNVWRIVYEASLI